MRRHAKALLAVAIAMASFFTSAGIASAAYVTTGNFALSVSGNSEDGGLLSPGQADVNDKIGKLYVADTGNNRVQVFKFDETGGELKLKGEYDSQAPFPEPSGLTIDQSNGDVYVSSPAGITKLDSDLNPVADWANPGVSGALAIDPTNGDLLVASQSANQVLRFHPNGEADAINPGFAAERPLDVAVTATGEVLVVTSTGDIVTDCSQASTVRRFSAAGVELGTIGGSEAANGVAVDPDDGTIAIAVRNAGYFECATGGSPAVAFFDSTGAPLQTFALTGSGLNYATSTAIAVAGPSSRVFVIVRGPFNDGFGFTQAFVLASDTPGVDTAIPTGVTPAGEATLQGTVNPRGAELSECHFEYGPSVSYGQSIPCTETPAEIGSGQTDVPVHAEISGLAAGGYHFRLVASGAKGRIVGPDRSLLIPGPPVIVSQTATATTTEAELKATINAGGIAASYRFEYGLTDAYGQSTQAAQLPAGSSPVAVKVNLFGLTPASGYHYRVVVTNAVATVEGADRSFATQESGVSSDGCVNAAIRARQGSTYLPDCRAFEQVSPLDKNGTDVKSSVLRTSADGRAITWFGLGAYAGAPGASAQVQYVGRRSADGWRAIAFAPSKADYPHVEPGFDSLHEAFTWNGDLSALYFITSGADYDSNQKNSNRAIYRLDSSGRVVWVNHGEGVQLAGQEFDTELAGVSEDGSTAFFTQAEPLMPEVPDDGAQRLYRWRNGVVEAVGRGEDGSLLSSSRLGMGASSGGYGGSQAGQLPDSVAISNDGSAFVYCDGANVSSPCVSGNVFLHEDGVGNVNISLSRRTGSVGQPASRAMLVATTPNLQKIYFYSPDQLTDDAPVGGGAYVYDRGTQVLGFSNPIDPMFASQPPGPEGSGMSRVSADGSHVYYVSTRVLASGATENKLNLYLDHAGSTRLVGILADSDLGVAANPYWEYPELTNTGIDASGSKFAFQSRASLGGADAGGHSVVYLYDAEVDSLDCISCPRDGSAPKSDSTLAGPPADKRNFTPKAMSADGDAVFFTSEESLVARDVNEGADVYEYRDGMVHLISGGTSPSPSYFAGTSPDGVDAYIFTRQSLAASDIDGGATDVYDVRAGGGFAEPSVSGECDGEACQGDGLAPPASSSVGSREVSGPQTRKQHRAKKKHVRKKKHRRAHHKKRGHGHGKAAKKNAKVSK